MSKQTEDNITKTIIRDLTLMMSIGIHDFEKQQPQKIIVNIETYSDRLNFHNIEDTINYERVTNDVVSLSQSQHYDLVESFAQDIADICLQQDSAHKVMVRVEKPDIIKNTKSVGVEIFRSK